MSDSDHYGFGKLMPGFDFLQNLMQTAAGQATTPPLGPWLASTLDAEELDKRIAELKTVRFWLEQNATAITATIQALEVQKMTLATLKGMNFNFAQAGEGETTAQANAGGPAPKAGAVDPMQLWSALTQQFQKIAECALQETHKPSRQGAPSKANATAQRAAGAPKPRASTARKSARKTPSAN